jgi:hypothetical protein
MVDPLEDQPAGLELSQQYRGRYELPSEREDHVYVYVDFKFAANDQGQEFGDLFTLNATYLLVYKLLSASERPADALQYFAELNGTYNVWPYWRELVQTVAGRIGLGSVIVPVFHPPIKEIGPASNERDNNGETDQPTEPKPAKKGRSRTRGATTTGEGQTGTP